MNMCSENKRKKKMGQHVKNKLRNMSREAIVAALSKKKECTRRAVAIVEQMIEPNVGVIWLLENLQHINQSHFQDAVEERAIVKLCGYPLCSNSLGDIPNKLYKISTRENKVYNITDRKNYCSNICYKASIFLKDQLYTSPLWLRDCEDPVTYEILRLAHQSVGGAGEEIDLGVTSPVKLEESVFDKINKKNHNDNSSSDKEGEKSGESEDCKFNSLEDSKNTESTKEVDNGKPIDDSNIIEAGVLVDTVQKVNESVRETVVEKNMEEVKLPEADVCRNSLPVGSVRAKSRKKVEVSVVNVVMKLEERLRNWFTLDTLLFLLGDLRLQEVLRASGVGLDQIPQAQADPYIYDRYQEIYRKLNLLELQDPDEDRVQPSRPLPDYDRLKAEAKQLEVKVRSFYKGDSVVRFSEEVDQEQDSAEGAMDPVLPLIDHHAVRATRRRIVLERLHKILPEMQTTLGLSHHYLSSELRELVATFNLGPSNIVMRPPEWTLVALFIIKILTIRNEDLCLSFGSSRTQFFVENILKNYLEPPMVPGYLDRLVSYLMDLNHLKSNQVT